MSAYTETCFYNTDEQWELYCPCSIHIILLYFTLLHWHPSTTTKSRDYPTRARLLPSCPLLQCRSAPHEASAGQTSASYPPQFSPSAASPPQSILHNAFLLCLVHCWPNKVAHIAESGRLDTGNVTDLSLWLVCSPTVCTYVRDSNPAQPAIWARVST